MQLVLYIHYPKTPKPQLLCVVVCIDLINLRRLLIEKALLPRWRAQGTNSGTPLLHLWQGQRERTYTVDLSSSWASAWYPFWGQRPPTDRVGPNHRQALYSYGFLVLRAVDLNLIKLVRFNYS